MATKQIKQVIDATGSIFNAVFSQNSSNEYTQMVAVSDGDGNLNSGTFPLFNMNAGVNFIEPASFQTNTLLASGASYTSNIESALLQPNLQLQARGVGSYTVTVNQFKDIAGAKLLQSQTFTRASGVQINENLSITGNYVQLVYTNTSGAAMTETMLYASLGMMPVTPDSLGQATTAKSIPVTLPSDSATTGITVRSTPGITANNTRVGARVNQFGEIVTSTAAPQQFALENTYGIAPINPTIGTPISLTTATATSYVGTAPSLLIRNAAAANGKDVIISSIELSMIGAGTGLTDFWVEVHVDTANRYSSGGIAVAGKSMYAQTAATAFSMYTASTAIVATADTTTYTRVFRRRVRTVAPVAGDVYKLVFDGQYDSGSYALNSTVPQVYNVQAPVCVIPPAGSAVIYIYATGMTAAPTFEGTVEYIER